MADSKTGAEMDRARADSLYNEGVALGRQRRDDEAAKRWEEALALDPGHVDAHYNLAQYLYLRGRPAEALAHWQAAARGAPEDFEIHKKIVQAHHAMGDFAGGAAAQAELRRLWEASADPQVRALSDYVVDQLTAAGRRVMVHETLRPPSDDLYYAYTFRVLGERGEALMTVQLESSAYGRETGVPYLLGMTRGAVHRTTGPAFSQLPPYGELRPLAVRLIEDSLAEK